MCCLQLIFQCMLTLCNRRRILVVRIVPNDIYMAVTPSLQIQEIIVLGIMVEASNDLFL